MTLKRLILELALVGLGRIKHIKNLKLEFKWVGRVGHILQHKLVSRTDYRQ